MTRSTATLREELEALAGWFELFRPGPLYDLLPPVGEVTGKSAAKMLRSLVSENAPTELSRKVAKQVAAKILSDYKEHYSFPPQGESHMHDCIMDALEAELPSVPSATAAICQVLPLPPQPPTITTSTHSSTGPHEPPTVYDPAQGMVKPGGLRALMTELRQLFDKTADAHAADYPDKVNHGLVAVYAHGRRQAPHSAKGENWIAVEKAKADAYEDAALRVEKISEDYYHEHGSYDGSTNAWELHHRHMEYVEALDAAVEAIRKRKAEKCQVTQAIAPSDEGREKP